MSDPGVAGSPPLPANLEAEIALLGAVLRQNAVLDQVGALAPDHFSERVHQRIFAAARDEIAAGRGASPVTLAGRFAADPDLQQLGGVSYLMSLTGDVLAYTVSPADLARIVVDLAARRSLIAELNEAAVKCADESHPIRTIGARVLGAIEGSLPDDAQLRTFSFAQAFAAGLDQIDDVAAGRVSPGVCIEGLSDWNDITGGMRPGDLIYLAGRPSMGKTCLVLGVSWRAAAAGHGVLLISREMDVAQLMPRILADLLLKEGGDATFADIRAGKVSGSDMALLKSIEKRLARLPLVIADPDTLTAEDVGLLVRRHRRAFAERGITLGLVVVDYLGLIDAPDRKSNREQEVSLISKTLKGIARRNEVPLLVLSQLSRGVEQREDKRPTLSDLRDSGSLEQDADQVIFVYREEYYLQRAEPDPSDVRKRPAWEESMRAARDRIDIFSAKNRQGELVKRRGWFFGRNQAVRNSDHYKTWGDV